MDCRFDRRPPPRRGREHTSFSASLLDSIYRSLDTSSPEKPITKQTKTKPPDPLPLSKINKKTANPDFWWASKKKPAQPDSYTSSDSSSFGFSSDAESSRSRPVRPNRVQFNPPLPPKTPPHEKKKSKTNKRSSISSRIKEFRKGRASSSSPSPFASLLKAIFSSTRKGKKQKTAVMAPALPPDEPPPPPAHPAPANRSVRFSDVREDKVLDGADIEAAMVKRKVEELLRSLEREEEELEEEGGESDSSSDLFELENLTEIESYELPVYGTTRLAVANHRAVGHRLVA